MTEFDRGVAVRSTDDGRYSVGIDGDWFVQNGPNGGYLASVLLAALADAAEGRPARSLTVYYLTSSVAGPATVEVDVLRTGRSLAFLGARLRQGDSLVAHAVAAFGSGRSDLEFQDVRPAADVPMPEDLPAPTQVQEVPPLVHRFDYRPVTPPALFSGADSELWAWLRLRDPRPVDAVLLATYVDALIPPMLLRATTPLLVPTVEITIHLRNAPTPGYDDWCLGHVATRTAADGFIEEDCDIYDRDGRLLAQSRQLAIIVPLG